MRRFKWWMIVIGAGLTIMGVREFMLANKAKAQPQQITCAQLAKDGPGKNAHVVMGEFALSTSSFVYQEKKRSKEWEKVWIPALPLDDPWFARMEKYWKLDEALRGVTKVPVPETFGVIVLSSDVSNETDLGRFNGQDTIQGLVINEVDSLSGDERKLLKESYPGIDVEKCWILEHGRKPKGMAAIAGYLLAGLVLLGLGIKQFLRRKTAA